MRTPNPARLSGWTEQSCSFGAVGQLGRSLMFLLPWKNAFFCSQHKFHYCERCVFFYLTNSSALPLSLSTPLSYPLRSSYFLSITSYCSWMNKWSVVNDWPPKKPDVDVPSAGSSAGSLVGTTRLVSSGDQAWLSLSVSFIILRKQAGANQTFIFISQFVVVTCYPHF